MGLSSLREYFIPPAQVKEERECYIIMYLSCSFGELILQFERIFIFFSHRVNSLRLRKY